MKTATYAGVAMLLTAGIAGCATTTTSEQLREQGHEPLTSSELQRLFDRGATQQWSAGGNSGTTEYMPDGSATIKAGSFETEGSWRITDDQLCTRYNDLDDGEERCLTIFEVDDGYRIVGEDGTVSRATFE